MDILRNLWRRRLRTTLTVSGIVMGIFALTTMGALAEHFNALLGGGVTYYSSSIQISDDKSSGVFGGGLLTLSTLDRVRAVPGVKAVGPSVMVLAKPGSTSAVNFGVPDYIANYDPATAGLSAFTMSLRGGRWVSDASHNEVVLGSTMAAEFKAHVGDTVRLPVRPKNPTPGFTNHAFTVVGLVDKTLSAPDNGAFVSLRDAQTLQAESLPEAVTSKVDAYQVVSGAAAFGGKNADLDAIATRITDQVPGVKATKPSELVSSFKSGGAVFTFMTTAGALLALIIGGLSVVNTMIMSVTERVREIGLKKAIGARTQHILREFLAEATTMGLIGGVAGFLLGVLMTLALNAGDPSGGIFLVTPRLTLIALIFAVALGAGAGALPAVRAARMDPVTALRSQ